MMRWTVSCLNICTDFHILESWSDACALRYVCDNTPIVGVKHVETRTLFAAGLVLCRYLQLLIEQMNQL